MILTDRIIWQSFKQKRISVCERNILLDSDYEQRRKAENIQAIFDAQKKHMEEKYPSLQNRT